MFIRPIFSRFNFRGLESQTGDVYLWYALQDGSFIWYQDPPVDLVELITYKDGMYCNRAIPDLAACL